jgi:hypothetical protein
MFPQLPAYLQNSRIPNFTERLGANLGTRAQPHVSIDGDRLTLVDTTGDMRPVLTRDPKTDDPYLDCVIIDAGDHESKIYYGRAYDPKAETFSPPACWSDNGVAPSANCSEPQAISCTPDPSGQHGCKWAVWGSGRAREGSKVIPPACAKYQKVALLIPGEDIQFLLRVPPNSLVELANYNGKFKGHAFAMPDVFTRISLRDKTLFFVGLGLIDEETAKLRDQVLLAKKTDALVGRGDKPRQAGPAPVVTLPAPDPAWSAISGTMPPAPTAASTLRWHGETDPTALLASASAEPPGPLFTSANPAATSAPVAATSTTAPSTSAPTRRRPGRPRKEAAPATESVQQGNGPTAPFPHGMAQAPEPNTGLEAALKSVFG